MNEDNKIIIGNITTIITSISLSFAGLIIGILASWGLQLPFDQTSLAGFIGLILMFIFSLINTKFKSSFFIDKDKDTLTIDVTDLTDAQVTAINSFVENASELNTVNVAGKTFNRYNDSQIFDNDAPVLNDEYETNNDNEDEGC